VPFKEFLITIKLKALNQKIPKDIIRELYLKHNDVSLKIALNVIKIGGRLEKQRETYMLFGLMYYNNSKIG
jgi:hypothetical protein